MIYKRIKNTNFEQSATNKSTNTLELAKRNTIITLFFVISCFVICWIQNQVVYLLYLIGLNINFYSAYYQYTVLMVFLNCTVNPFVYLIKYKEYQKALKDIIMCNRHSDTTSEVDTISSQIESVWKQRFALKQRTKGNTE